MRYFARHRTTRGQGYLWSQGSLWSQSQTEPVAINHRVPQE